MTIAGRVQAQVTILLHLLRWSPSVALPNLRNFAICLTHSYAKFDPLIMQATEPKVGRSDGLLAQVGVLKTRLLLERLDATSEAETHAAIIRQAHEAERLAWKSHYPLLTFPCLFEERAATACAQARAQANLYWRNLRMAAPVGVTADGSDMSGSEAVPEAIDTGRYLMLIRQRYAKPPITLPIDMTNPPTFFRVRAY